MKMPCTSDVRVKVRSRHARWRGILCGLIAAPVAWVLVVPAPAAARAEQIVIPVVDEAVTFEFPDPCRGGILNAEGTENGIIRITELAERGHHVRVSVRGVAELYDDAGVLIGTWTYHLRFLDQFPPDAHGAVGQISVGPLEYADGSSAIVQGHEHEVFDKGDVLKGSSSRRPAAGSAAEHRAATVAAGVWV